jgi:hypothetical protein
MSFVSQRGSLSAAGFGRTIETPSPTGAFLFWYSGTYTITIPAGVTKVSMAAVGAGGGGSGGDTNYGGTGGGGGALAYSNDVAVTAGEVLTISVSSGGYGGSPSYTPASNSHTDTTISRGATVLLRAAKGGRAGGIFDPGIGGLASACVGQFAFSGGNGGTKASSGGSARAGGGGGSGGWSGVGGNGGNNGGAGTNGSGGAGAGGASVTNNYQAACNGGATLWYGEGASGVGRSNDLGTLGSALGGALTGPRYNGNTSYNPNGSGGGGAPLNGYGGSGGDGWARIVFGGGAVFPTTVTSSNVITFVASSVSTGTTITVPATAKVGDLMVLIDVWDTSGVMVYGTIPTGFQSMTSQMDYTNLAGSIISAKQITSPSEIGSTITATNTDYAVFNNKMLLVFRGTRFASIGYCGTYNAYFADASTYPQTLSQSGYVATYDPYAFGIPIALSYFRGSSGITPATDITWSGATFIQGSTNVWQVGYKIFSQSTTNVNESISMVDRGTNYQVVGLISVY